MDVDLESVEIVFAQKLTSGEPTIRNKALKTLHAWIKEQSANKPFTEADMIRLCKGLHYTMWMQDKMLMQEELADRIGGLLLTFNYESERVLYIRSTFKSLSKEWIHIDRWRMDKFLMLIRRVLRVLFSHLRNHKWKKELRDPYWQAFTETTISADASFSKALKFHFASILLDEMDLAGDITKKQITACLRPYFDLLSDHKIDDYLFDSILDEIFVTILRQCSAVVQAKMEIEEEGGEAEEKSDGIKFDYLTLGKMLFDIGKNPECNSSRRTKLYDLVKRFETAASGGDPYHFETPVPKEQLTKEDFERVNEKNKQHAEEVKQARLEARKAIKEAKRLAREAQQAKEVSMQDDNEDGEEQDEETRKPKSKAIKKSKSAVTKRKAAKRNSASIKKPNGRKIKK